MRRPVAVPHMLGQWLLLVEVGLARHLPLQAAVGRLVVQLPAQGRARADPCARAFVHRARCPRRLFCHQNQTKQQAHRGARRRVKKELGLDTAAHGNRPRRVSSQPQGSKQLCARAVS
eukprot:Amastigsp_a346220_25.p3 type:complete len:118 gc:universal Amastigsp_a346220_25:1470-1823(+)